MRIVDFDSDPELLKRFLDWPCQHYASDPNWMPDPTEARLLAESDSSPKTWRNFLVMDQNEIRGRVTAMISPALYDEKNRPYGQLGFFECVDDPKAAQLLVDSVIHWLSARLPGRSTLLAPLNFDTWHSYRLRTKGFDEPTFFMEPYNPSYYPALFAALNFKPVSQYITKTVTALAPLLAFWESYHRNYFSKGFTVRSFDLGAINDEMSLIYRLSLTMFRENLFFTEISATEFRALYSGAAGSLDPDLFLFLLDPSGEPVGLCFSIADHRQPKTVNVKTFGVLPHVRGAGVGAAFAYEIYQRFQTRGFARVNHCLMRAGNRADGFDGGLGEVTREYALYARTLRP